MPNYSLLVLSNPVPGREDDFNRWYTHVHLDDVRSIEGFTGARRYRILNDDGIVAHYSYLAVYDLETNDVSATMNELRRRGQSGEMLISDALDRNVVTYLCEPILGEGDAI